MRKRKFEATLQRLLTEVKKGYPVTFDIRKKRSGEEEIEAIIVELAGSDAAFVTRLGNQLEELKRKEEETKGMLDELRGTRTEIGKMRLLDEKYFDAADYVNSRILKTAELSLKFCRMVESTEIKETADPTKVKEAFKEIARMIGDKFPELMDKLKEIERNVIKVDTIVKTAEDKRRLPTVISEASLPEVLKDLKERVSALASKLIESLRSWGKGFDEGLGKVRERISDAKALARA